MKFKTLFLKELKQENAWFTIGLLGLIGVEFILLLFSGRWPEACLCINGCLFLAIPICVLYNIVHSHTSEWARNTSQYLFSLPIRGWHIEWAKFTVQAIILIVFSLIAFFATYLIAKARFGHTLGLTPLEITKFWLIYIACILPALPFVVFPYVVGQCFARLRRLIIWVVFIGMIGGVEYIIRVGFKIFSFLPSATITITGETHRSANFFPGLAVWILFGLVLFWGIGLLLDRWAQT